MLPVSASLAHFRLLAQTQAKKVKITGISAMALSNIAGNSLIRVDTDSGVTGYGEAGATGPMARARIQTIKPLLLGKDPLEIEVHFQQMSSMMYNYMAHIPTVSGIDIALNCHGEFDTLSSIGIAKGVAAMNALCVGDPMPPVFSEGWVALRRSTNLTLLTGEKVELVRGFRPFLDSQVVDIIHPDLAFAGGITGTKKVADFAALSRTPVALHNVGSLVLTYANAHFAASIQNFYKSESALGREGHHLAGMAATNAPIERGGMLKVMTFASECALRLIQVLNR